jgi:hypothetical protein
MDATIMRVPLGFTGQTLTYATFVCKNEKCRTILSVSVVEFSPAPKVLA